MIGPDSPVLAVLGAAAEAKAGKFEALGINTVSDLLMHFPRRYLKMGELSKVESLAEGQMLTVMGQIVDSEQKPYQDRRSKRMAYRQEVMLETDGPRLRVTFFAKRKSVADWQASRLVEGRKGVFTGLVSTFQGRWQLTNPRMVLFGGDGEQPGSDEPLIDLMDYQRAIYPLYPAGRGIESWDIQRAVAFALSVTDPLADPLSEETRSRNKLLSRQQALLQIHCPDDLDQAYEGQRYFRFHEALITQLVLVRRRAQLRAAGAKPRVGMALGGLLEQFDERLPFKLTRGQIEVSRVLEKELAQAHPMNRLLQGEVGSGKTIVALRAMLRVVDSGAQAALLAPTEVLAQQHYRSISALMGDLAAGGMLGGSDDATHIALLTGSLPKAKQRAELLKIASGEAGLVIGTHALLQEHVQFADLGLVVVDEQHRFGVEQRAELTSKSSLPPHVLVMTATPIPRTVAMTVFGDLEVSTLSELPQGRGTVATTVVPLTEQPHWWDRVWARAAEEVRSGRQVYVVCPCIEPNLVESGEALVAELDNRGQAMPPPDSLAAVEAIALDLASVPQLKGLRIAKLHGRMAADEKDRAMSDFAAGKTDILVATTVIEVGLDVGNATAMVVLDADRFGVSQLHQLRGRVGRSVHDGLCLLVTRAVPGSDARVRLEAVAKTTDGFALSQVDLDLRREGDVLGASQSGAHSSLRQLRVLRDEATIVAARSEAELLVAADPDLEAAPTLAREVVGLEDSVKSEFIDKS
jgi:ATP-dependent DNA helicase RecG